MNHLRLVTSQAFEDGVGSAETVHSLAAANQLPGLVITSHLNPDHPSLMLRKLGSYPPRQNGLAVALARNRSDRTNPVYP